MNIAEKWQWKPSRTSNDSISKYFAQLSIFWPHYLLSVPQTRQTFLMQRLFLDPQAAGSSCFLEFSSHSKEPWPLNKLKFFPFSNLTQHLFLHNTNQDLKLRWWYIFLWSCSLPPHPVHKCYKNGECGTWSLLSQSWEMPWLREGLHKFLLDEKINNSDITFYNMFIKGLWTT